MPPSVSRSPAFARALQEVDRQARQQQRDDQDPVAVLGHDARQQPVAGEDQRQRAERDAPAAQQQQRRAEQDQRRDDLDGDPVAGRVVVEGPGVVAVAGQAAVETNRLVVEVVLEVVLVVADEVAGRRDVGHERRQVHRDEARDADEQRRREQHGPKALEVERDVVLGPHRADAGRGDEQAAEEQQQVRRRVDRVDADLEAVLGVPDEVGRAAEAEREQADDRDAVADRDRLQVGDQRLARVHAGGELVTRRRAGRSRRRSRSSRRRGTGAGSTRTTPGRSRCCGRARRRTSRRSARSSARR